MRKLDIRFTELQEVKISDLVELTKTNKSTVARAAMQIGLNHLLDLASKDKPNLTVEILKNDFNAR